MNEKIDEAMKLLNEIADSLREIKTMQNVLFQDQQRINIRDKLFVKFMKENYIE